MRCAPLLPHVSDAQDPEVTYILNVICLRTFYHPIVNISAKVTSRLSTQSWSLYILTHAGFVPADGLYLEPCNMQGPYVLVLVARGERGTGPEDERRSRLPAMWLIKAYSRLTRPYKKNVRDSVGPQHNGF